MGGSASVEFSGRPRGMSLTGFLASLIISELVHSFFDLSPLWRHLLYIVMMKNDLGFC